MKKLYKAVDGSCWSRIETPDIQMSTEDDRERESSQDDELAQGTPEEQEAPSPRSDKPQTISLLDLMNSDEPLVVSEADIAALSPDDEETGPLVIPEESLQPPSGESPAAIPQILPPLYADDLMPDDRPPERDEEATVVQPRIAFPGHTRFDPTDPPNEADVSERTTAWYERPTPQAERETEPPQESPTPAAARQDTPPQQGTTPRRERTATPEDTPRPRQRPAQPPIEATPRQDAVARRTEPVRDRPPLRPQPQRQPDTPPAAVDNVVRSQPKRNWGGCVRRIISTSLALGFIGSVIGLIALIIGYISIASQLPPPTELQQRASTFETARIYDRNGSELYALVDPNAGDRSPVLLGQIDQDLINATIATEDARFYTNPGFDPISIGRAIFQAARERDFVGGGGASTITQQLARALLLDEEERTQRTFSRKVKEIILAAEIFRTYDKDIILELYLNEIYYGNRAYGIEAAAQTYFRKSAADLTLAEASLLAGLPQAPAVWDPFTNPEFALGRQSEVLSLMTSQGYVTFAEAQSALESSTEVVRSFEPPRVNIEYPHFVFTVLRQLEDAGDAQSIYRGGLRIHTTLDPEAQRLAEATLTAQEANINAAGANNAALVAIEPGTGEILALVGSVDFNDEAISGQVNMALQPSTLR